MHSSLICKKEAVVTEKNGNKETMKYSDGPRMVGHWDIHIRY